MTKTRLIVLCSFLSFSLANWGAVASLAAPQDEHTPPQATVPPDEAPASDEASQLAIHRPQGNVITPESSVVHPEDAGVRAHTNHLIFVPAGHQASSANPDFTFAETPASLACVYKVGPTYSGCNPTTGATSHATGGWGAIALVDAYDNPNAGSDLAFFSSYWGLPVAKYSRVLANSTFGTLNGLTASCSGTPAGNTGWGLEEDLDIQWAHAMAPQARIILVEACSNSYNDLLFAEQVAGIKVASWGGGDISNSWGSGEFSTEVGAGADDLFHRYYWQYITYFASAGDSGWGAQYPSSSPWVVSAGGTTVNRDANGNYLSQSCWSGSGGGVSAFELWQSPPNISNGMGPWADYQYPFAGQTARQTPDLSFDADPASGVWVYDTYGYGGWVVVGGTSVASPSLAGIVNASNNRLGQAPYTGGYYTTEENNLIYDQLYSYTAYPANFRDVTTGSNGVSAGVGYDQCTGVGTPYGHLGK
jgi:kumamolisin